MNFFIILAIVFVVLFYDAYSKSKRNKEEIDDLITHDKFSSSKQFAQLADKEVHFDMEKKEMAIFDKSEKPVSVSYIPFSSILECEILENNISIAKGGIGRAVIGGVVAGGVGAVVGSSTAKNSSYSDQLSLRIITKNLDHPLFVITYVSYKTKKSSSLYQSKFKDIQQLYALLTSIIKSNEDSLSENKTQGEMESLTEQIKKLSDLHKDGILTDQEFESKKADILSRM